MILEWLLGLFLAGFMLPFVVAAAALVAVHVLEFLLFSVVMAGETLAAVLLRKIVDHETHKPGRNPLRKEPPLTSSVRSKRHRQERR